MFGHDFQSETAMVLLWHILTVLLLHCSYFLARKYYLLLLQCKVEKLEEASGPLAEGSPSNWCAR